MLIGVLLGTWYNPWFYGLSGFVGAGLAFAGIIDTCAMGMALALGCVSFGQQSYFEATY